MSINEKLTEVLSASSAAPVLFIGSGFSRRYLGTNDWEGLLEKFAGPLKHEFRYYKSKVRNNNLPQVASIMAAEFHGIWWDNEEYETQRDLFEAEAINYDSPLKIEIATYLKTFSLLESDMIEREIALLKEINKKGVIDTIITTNWDGFLENEIFQDYDVLIGQDELLASNNIGLEEIHKIHGCVSNPNSFILTEEDYIDFNDKNAYLAAKLLTTFIEHPVIFIGYSLNDKNIQQILVNIGRCLPSKFMKRLENNLIFVNFLSDKDEEARFTRSTVTIEEVNIPRIVISAHEFSDIYSSILSYERRFPIKLVKLMENQLYDIVIKNNPKNQVIAGDISNLSEIAEADFVVGIGINEKVKATGVELSQKGIIGLEYNEYLVDVIKDNIVCSESEFVHSIIERLLPRKPNYPMFKYLYYADYRTPEQIEKLDAKIKSRLRKSFEESFIIESYKRKIEDVRSKYPDLNSLITDPDLEENYKISYIPLMEVDKIDEELLKTFIEERMSLLEDDCFSKLSDFRKLIKVYDWVKYRHLVI